MTTTTVCASVVALLLATGSASAQTTARRTVPVDKRERVFVMISGGVQAKPQALSDSFTHDVNAETGEVIVEYPGRAATLADVTAGVRLWKSGGVAIAVSRASTDGTAQIEAAIPHPLFDDQDRQVSGEADGIERSENAVHVQLYMLKTRGRWKIRVLGGGTYFRIEQDIVTDVSVNETFPFDTATFRSATTARGDGSALGFNVGADLTWMAARSAGLGVLVRYARGSVELNAGGNRNVSTDVGGLQAAGGVRFVF